jgi:hypothetical protein
MTTRTLDAAALSDALDAQGWAATGSLITDGDADALAAAFDDDTRYRSRVEMGRYRYGEGDYAYFAYPLPTVVQRLREELYAALVGIADAWATRLGTDEPWPRTLDRFLVRCHAAGQARPTPLVLRYHDGGYNALHQDRYGPVAFPLQVVIGLTEPGVDYCGGEFLLAEQRPRQQTRVTAIPLHKGHGIVFPNDRRPVPSRRGTTSAVHRHGASTVSSGTRVALGVIFHDAA